jgi:hypothetical protein
LNSWKRCWNSLNISLSIVFTTHILSS